VQFVETRVRLSVVQLDGHFSRVKCREQGPIHQMFLAVVLPDGTVVEPRVAERMSSTASVIGTSSEPLCHRFLLAYGTDHLGVAREFSLEWPVSFF
jgi:hypothetical protein